MCQGWWCCWLHPSWSPHHHHHHHEQFSFLQIIRCKLHVSWQLCYLGWPIRRPIEVVASGDGAPISVLLIASIVFPPSLTPWIGKGVGNLQGRNVFRLLEDIKVKAVLGSRTTNLSILLKTRIVSLTIESSQHKKTSKGKTMVKPEGREFHSLGAIVEKALFVATAFPNICLSSF